MRRAVSTVARLLSRYRRFILEPIYTFIVTQKCKECVKFWFVAASLFLPAFPDSMIYLSPYAPSCMERCGLYRLTNPFILCLPIGLIHPLSLRYNKAAPPVQYPGRKERGDSSRHPSRHYGTRSGKHDARLSQSTETRHLRRRIRHPLRYGQPVRRLSQRRYRLHLQRHRQAVTDSRGMPAAYAPRFLSSIPV